VVGERLDLHPALRGALAALCAPASLQHRLAETVNRSVAAEAATFQVPSSALWSVIRAAQYAVTALLLFSALWFAALFVIHDAPVSSTNVPYLGAVPTPVALLAVTLLVGYLFAKLLQLHAGWLGRRWAKRVGARITGEVRQGVVDELLVPLDRFEASRAVLNKAMGVADDCVEAAV
jgi:hypothetical protein